MSSSNQRKNSGDIPVATVVDDPIKKIQIPPNARPGDSFIVTDYGIPFTVIVPEGAPPGSYINVIVPQEATVVGHDGGSQNQNRIKIDKSVAGAAILGGAVGFLIAGPVIGVLAAGGAALAATQKDGQIGKTAREAGKKTYDAMDKATKWVEKRIHCVDR